jgi:hypothetical protein
MTAHRAPRTLRVREALVSVTSRGQFGLVRGEGVNFFDLP